MFYALDQIRVSLAQARSGDDLDHSLLQLHKLGPAGIHLLPDLIAALGRGAEFSMCLFIPLVAFFKSSHLFDVLEQRNLIFELEVTERISLLRAGFSQLAPSLVQSLQEFDKRAGDRLEIDIIEALGESATARVVPEMEKILNKKSKSPSAASDSSVTEILEALESAINSARSRPDPIM